MEYICMNEGPESLPDEQISSILASQQSTYEHIQSMSATFLSIIIALVATFSGLISAGIITVQLPDIPEITDQLVVVPRLVSFPPETASTLLRSSIIYGQLYFIASLPFVFTSISYFIFCLNIKPLDPEKSIRKTDDIRNIDNRNQVKIRWIENNIRELELLTSQFNVAKTNLIYSFVILLFCSGIIINLLNPSGLMLLLVVSLPVLTVILYILSLITRFTRIYFDLYKTDIVRENSIFYTRIRSLDPIIASVLSMYRKSSIDTLFPRDGKSIPILISSIFFLLSGFLYNILAFLQMAPI